VKRSTGSADVGGLGSGRGERNMKKKGRRVPGQRNASQTEARGGGGIRGCGIAAGMEVKLKFSNLQGKEEERGLKGGEEKEIKRGYKGRRGKGEVRVEGVQI